MAKRQTHHSLSTSEETTAPHWAGTGGHRLLTLLDWKENSGKMGTDASTKCGFGQTEDQAEKAMTFTFGNDETLILPLELEVAMEYCVCTWYLEEHRSCCRKNF